MYTLTDDIAVMLIALNVKAAYIYKYIRPRNTRMEIHAGRVVCCPLVTHIK